MNEDDGMNPRINVDDLTLRYRKVEALTEVSFRVEGPGIRGLLGRNGSGKTTLLSVLAGFRRATSGTVLLDGDSIFENPRATRRICLIRGPGDTVEPDWPEDRVKHALALAARLRPHWDAGYAAHLVERFELDPERRIGELSQGKRCALGAVLGLAARAPVTLFDETHVAMDAPARRIFNDELLADYMAHPRLIMLSTHLIGEVGALLDEVLILDRGRLLLHEDADTLRARGVTVTGPADATERFTVGLEVLDRRELGPTRSVAVYGELDEARRMEAARAGLELGPLPLQDLFIHLTGGSR